MTATEPQIHRDDIEAKFVELQKNVENATKSARAAGTKIGIAALILLVIMVFVIGRRKGKQSRTVVEIRRL